MIDDYKVCLALKRQVFRCLKKGVTTGQVVTIVTRPMWKAWCRFVGTPETSMPYNCSWAHPMKEQICGTTTLIAPGETMASLSYVRKPTPE